MKLIRNVIPRQSLALLEITATIIVTLLFSCIVHAGPLSSAARSTAIHGSESQPSFFLGLLWLLTLSGLGVFMIKEEGNVGSKIVGAIFVVAGLAAAGVNWL